MMNWELECNANLAKREQAMADARAVMMQSAVKSSRDISPRSFRSACSVTKSDCNFVNNMANLSAISFS